MRTIAHISDLHFGYADPIKIEGLIDSLRKLQPDVVILSGDITERGKSEEFREAQLFLTNLHLSRVIIIPGNHDLPRYRALPFRILMPLAKFNKYISPNLNPSYQDDRIAIIGVNSARRLPTKFGRFDSKDVERVRTYFSHQAPKSAVKILVVHHPFDVPLCQDQRDIVGGAAEAMQVISDCQVDVVLSGHTHRTYISESRNRYRHLSFCSVLAQAGTAASLRMRGEPNAFNFIKLQNIFLNITTHIWDHSRNAFQFSSNRRFEKNIDGWKTAI